MKTFPILLQCVLFLAIGFPAVAADKSDIAGTWSGTIDLYGTELPIVFVIKNKGKLDYTAVLRSPTQTDKDIPATAVWLKDRDVTISVDSVKGTFKGKLVSSGNSIRGDWIQGGNKLSLNLKFNEDGYALKRPQTPKPPYPYESIEVVIPNELGDNRLAGTLTKPKKPVRPVPGVVLISGSGPQDRDEFIAGHRPFAVIADYLTRRGIAVLRYDDRGTGKSTGSFEFGTTMDFATDAFAAAGFLKAQKDIDPGKVGLLGHSEGGLIAPIVATKRGDIAFIVMLAGPGLRGDKTLLSQSKALGEAAKLPPELIALNQRFSQSMFDIVSQEQPDLEKAGKLGQEFGKKAKELAPNLEDLVGFADFGEAIAQQMKMLETSWFRNFLKLDPGEYLQKVTCPVLALNGERDLQVIADLQLPAIEGHLSSGGNKQFETRRFSGLNHLFQKAETGLPSEYTKIEETISPLVLKAIGDWIEKTAR